MRQMEIQIDSKSREPITEQLLRQIREQIASGILRVNEKLPSVSELADKLNISRFTTGRVYDELDREGMIRKSGEHGCFVVCQR